MAEPVHRTVLAAAVGTILFVLFVPGTALVLVQSLLTGWRFAPPLLGWSATRWVGAGEPQVRRALRQHTPHDGRPWGVVAPSPGAR